MPFRPKQYCKSPNCNQLVDAKIGYCDKHKKPVGRYEEDRESASKRGYDRIWQRLRAVKLRHDPLCEECKRNDRIVIAIEVHHIKPVKLFPWLRLVWENLESLCKSCHSKKTAEENKNNN